MKKITNWVFSRILHGSSQRKAIASSLGLFLGLLPLGHFAWLVGMVASFLFRLNLITMLLGLCLSFLYPFFKYHLLLHIANSTMIPSWLQHPFLHHGLSSIVLAIITYPLFLVVYRHPKEIQLPEKKYVFRQNQKRWIYIKQSLKVFAFICTIIFVVFGLSIWTNSRVPTLYPDKQSKPELTSITQKLTRDSVDREDSQYDPTLSPHRTSHPEVKLTRYGFYVPWDASAWRELQYLDNIRKLDVLIPEWYSINSQATLTTNAEPEHQETIDSIARENKVGIMAMVNNVNNDEWDGNLLHQILSSPEKSDKLIHAIFTAVKKNKYIGINIDFETVNPQDKQKLTAFMSTLYHVFHKNKLKVTMDVPVEDEAFDYKALSGVSDQLIVMLHDKHYPTGEAGPIAPLGWVKHFVDTIPVPKSKLIFSFGTYGYDWDLGSNQPATSLTFDDIMGLVNKNHLQVQWDKVSKNPYIRYKKGKNEHIIWFLDGTTFYNQLQLITNTNTHGIAFWRIGSEDHSIWNLFAHPTRLEERVDQLRFFHSELPIYDGNGEILHISSPEKNGERLIHSTKNQWITDVSYRSYSNPFEVQRIGPVNQKQIALTFDDGPDSTYTPQIVDILNKHKVKATFFIVGENAVRNPDLVRKIFNSGHDIGNHTYTHPSVSSISPLRTKLELNSTQRLFQSITGHTMTTFRPPFQADTEMPINEDLRPVKAAQDHGYTMIAEKIDTLDWQRPPSNVIIQRVIDGLRYGNVILLHDAGGNRSHTVKALPKIIEYLKKNGYQLVPIHEMMGKNRNQIMPSISPQEKPFMFYDQLVFTFLDLWDHGFAFVLYLTIAIGFLRVLFLMFFSFRQHRKLQRLKDTDDRSSISFNPMVSVVIAAYNEEKVIRKTVKSVLDSNYSPLEVIVVNDGSTDQTEAVLHKEFGENAMVRIITKENGGKTAAINRGYRESKGEVIVSIDADTLIAKDAISLLVRHFKDDKIAAVSGNVKVGNIRNILTLWQHIEYITGFNLERRAFDELNCIPVVPGAIGAWRKSAVSAAGYFQDDTLAEDTDITITLLEMGYQIHFEDKAYAYTEAPEEIKGLLTQRTRWIFGTLQCLWKHRGSLFSKKQKSLGFISLPNMWIFQYGVQMISPYIDILCIFSLFTAEATRILVFYILFLLFDLVAAFFAFRLENENPKPLIWLVIQRFAYRQFMSYVVIKSLLYAIKGIPVGWDKIVRKGSSELTNTNN